MLRGPAARNSSTLYSFTALPQTLPPEETTPAEDDFVCHDPSPVKEETASFFHNLSPAVGLRAELLLLGCKGDANISPPVLLRVSGTWASAAVGIQIGASCARWTTYARRTRARGS